MKNKKAFMRTVEVMVAIILALLFLFYFIPKNTPEPQTKKFRISSLIEDDVFRDCVLSEDYDCAKTMVKSRLPKTYDVQVTDSQVYYPETKNNIFVESYLISGRVNETSIKRVRIYYWKK